MTTLVAKIALATAVVLGALLATVPAGAAAKRRSLRTECETRGWRTLAANEKIRLFLEPFGATASACRYDRRGTVEIGFDSSGGTDRPPYRIAGWFVVTDDQDCVRDGTCSGEVRVTNMRTGRMRRSVVAPENAGFHASALVVTVHGSVAWTRLPDSASPTFEVWLWPAGQVARRVDSVPRADARSLAAGNRVVYWTNNGQPRSAPLP